MPAESPYMMVAMGRSASLSLEQLLRLHGLTGKVPLNRKSNCVATWMPWRLCFGLGDFLAITWKGRGGSRLLAQDRAWAELQELYARVAVRPFDLRPELHNPLPSVPMQLALYEWEYMHGLETDRGWQSIRVTSPLTWVLTYSSAYSPAVLRQQLLDGQGQKNSRKLYELLF